MDVFLLVIGFLCVLVWTGIGMLGIVGELRDGSVSKKSDRH